MPTKHWLIAIVTSASSTYFRNMKLLEEEKGLKIMSIIQGYKFAISSQLKKVNGNFAYIFYVNIATRKKIAK